MEVSEDDRKRTQPSFPSQRPLHKALLLGYMKCLGTHASIYATVDVKKRTLSRSSSYY